MYWSFPELLAPARRKQRRGPVVALALALAVPVSPAAAQAVAELTVRGDLSYSPNPLLLPGDDRGAIQSEVTVDTKLTVTGDDLSEIVLRGTLSNRQYSRLYGGILFGEARIDATYRDSEYLSFIGTGQFRRLPLIDRLTTSVDAGIDPRAVSNAVYARLAVRWNPNARTTITPEFEAERTSYARSSLLDTTRSLRGAVAIATRTGPSISIGARGGARFSKAGAGSATTWFLDATLEKVLRDWKMNAELGVERNSFQAGTAPGSSRARSARLLIGGRASICRDLERREICLRGGLFSEVSGLGGLQRRTFVNVSMKQPIGARVGVRLLGEFQHAGLGSSGLPATDSYRAAAALEWTFLPNLTLGGTLEYIRRKFGFSDAIDTVFTGVSLRFTPRLQ